MGKHTTQKTTADAVTHKKAKSHVEKKAQKLKAPKEAAEKKPRKQSRAYAYQNKFARNVRDARGRQKIAKQTFSDSMRYEAYCVMNDPRRNKQYETLKSRILEKSRKKNPDGPVRARFPIRASAIKVAQDAVESMMAEVLNRARENTNNSKRVTMKPEDIELAAASNPHVRWALSQMMDIPVFSQALPKTVPTSA